MKLLTLLILNLLYCTSSFSQSNSEISGLWVAIRQPVTNFEGDIDNLDAASLRDILWTPELQYYFEGDSMWCLEYPCRVLSVDSINRKFWSIEGGMLFGTGGYVYKQLTFDTAQIQLLKEKHINSECYQGEWKLKRQESGGDGTGVEFIYPFEISDTLSLSVEQIRSIHHSYTVELFIGGKRRLFKAYFSSNLFTKILSLHPDDSWLDSNAQMWIKDWSTPELTEEELIELKEKQGENLVITFKK